MRPNPIQTNSFGWGIRSQVTRYGKSMVKMTEYQLDNGKKLVTLHNWKSGKRTSIVKELYGAGWNLIRTKTIEFVNGIKKVGG